MMVNLSMALLTGFLTVVSPGLSAEIEPWAEPGLKVRNGLALWLDSGRLNEGLSALGRKKVTEGKEASFWPDASGHGRHLEGYTHSPKLIAGALRFDGESTWMSRLGLDLHLDEFTLFVAATPLSNQGDFRGILATQRPGENDYLSGMNLDLGPKYSRRFEALNFEGRGSSGAVNLMTRPSDFGVVRRMTIASRVGPRGVSNRIDGVAGPSRDRAPGVVDAKSIYVGARMYGHGEEPKIQGFFDGDVLQILLYDRRLDDSEIEQVEHYLLDRLGGVEPIVRATRPLKDDPLVPVADPPPIQVMVPGFSTFELPVSLNNVNNVRYRADGKLVSLGYNGNIHVLSDTDGDGLEDKVEPFWENKGGIVAPIGMALTPPGYRLGEGVFVACKGKVSLVVDTDHDGKADREVIVATGWTPIDNNVDALGVALDPDGRVYFGLGATSYTNAYLIDKEGHSDYRLNGPNGTIQRVSADFSRRETIATGIRFSVGLAFNRQGDLFATDQEGATWLPNGNPYDELLHIQIGRHYGFPPRHPVHLPTVIDEPSTFDYAPQHQSTCGLTFNEPVRPGGPTFGPNDWAGDALVEGYSRGKLYRTKIIKGPSGYVAQNYLWGVLNKLTVDSCVSPDGDLVVATHGGSPDWGSGPSGKGALYKVRYRDREVPQPVLVWPEGPNELRVAFDRPIDPAQLKDVRDRAAIEYGKHVAPGDRFESLRPGYAVVNRQMQEPRHKVAIRSVQLTPDRRTLVMATGPQAIGPHALTLPSWGPPRPDGLRQVHEVDIGYDTSGVEVLWTPREGPGWSGWLPHPDLEVSRALTAGSAEHDRFWEMLKQPGRLWIRVLLDLRGMLRPAVQPGSRIDYELPGEEVALALNASGPIAILSSGEVTLEPSPEGPPRRALIVAAREEFNSEYTLPVQITIDSTGPGPINLEVSWTTREDAHPRPLPIRRTVLSWAESMRSESREEERETPFPLTGDWFRGRDLFFSELAHCSTCHSIQGRGGAIGPDLSNLRQRDPASVTRDIRDPSATIHPDYFTQVLALKDGRVLQGAVRPEGGLLIVSDRDGRQTTVDRDDVDEIQPSPVSIMPTGIADEMGREKFDDLMAFLLGEPIKPAPVDPETAPPKRPLSEVAAALRGSEAVVTPRTLRILLVSGPKDHGPGEHDYPVWRDRWSQLLAVDPAVEVLKAEGWPSDDLLDRADVVVMYSNNPGWDESKCEPLDRFLARGGGLALIHYAVDGHQAPDALAKRIGLAWKGGQSAFRHGPIDVDFKGNDHPITRGFGKLRLVDESYWDLVGDPARLPFRLLGSAVEDGAARPLFWTVEPPRGRVFVSIPGHYTWTFDDPLFRLLILRGIAWSAGESVDRFNGLATLGARLAD